MTAKPPPMTPDTLRLDDVMRQSAPLARLRLLLRESEERFEAIRPHLPTALRPHLRPGPVDDEGWSLLAANASVAAKLRQLKPRLEEVLAARWTVSAIRIKVQVA